MRTAYFLAICGPSGAGKSHLAMALVDRLGASVAARVPGDYFIKPVQGSFNDYLRQPLPYDWERMSMCLEGPLGREVETPVFDFTTFTRVPTGSSKRFTLRPIMIVDAMFPCPFADLQVLLTTPDTTRIERVTQRDREWRSHVIARWEHLEISRRHLESMHLRYDLVLSGAEPLADNLDHIVDLLRASAEPRLRWQPSAGSGHDGPAERS